MLDDAQDKKAFEEWLNNGFEQCLMQKRDDAMLVAHIPKHCRHALLRGDGGCALLWNGDESQGQVLLNELMSDASSVEHTLQTVASLEGFAFAFAFVDRRSQRVFFGRDQLGRRSLVYAINPNTGTLIVSSVCCLDITCDHEWTEWKELGVEGVYSMSLCDDVNHSPLKLHPWEDITRKEHIFSPRSGSIEPANDFNLSRYYESDDYMKTVQHFTHALERAVRKAVTFDSPSETFQEKSNPRIGVLFSGGIDSVVVAALACKCCAKDEEIDLLNVSFDHNNAADRKQSFHALEELRNIFPERTLRLVLINVDKEELRAYKETVENLIHPRSTVLDFNIGAALWFAARGRGKIAQFDKSDDSDTTIYQSPVRVILSGLGSDELLAGYRRHITQFRRNSWFGMDKEMDMDLRRLWIRNLGRDDRLISSHGRQLQIPFLDESFISVVRSMPLYCLAYPSEMDKLGDKKILRVAASKLLGLDVSATRVKRAIQFGSKISKISYKKCDGDNLLSSVEETAF